MQEVGQSGYAGRVESHLIRNKSLFLGLLILRYLSVMMLCMRDVCGECGRDVCGVQCTMWYNVCMRCVVCVCVVYGVMCGVCVCVFILLVNLNQITFLFSFQHFMPPKIQVVKQME